MQASNTMAAHQRKVKHSTILATAHHDLLQLDQPLCSLSCLKGRPLALTIFDSLSYHLQSFNGGLDLHVQHACLYTKFIIIAFLHVRQRENMMLWKSVGRGSLDSASKQESGCAGLQAALQITYRCKSRMRTTDITS